MFSAEQKLQQVLISEMHYGCSEEDATEIARVIRDRPNIDEGRVASLLYVIAETRDLRNRT